MTELFDTHSHILDKRFDNDREELLAGLPALGIKGFIEIGTTVLDSKEAAALALRVPYMYAAAGVHPHEAKNVSDGYTEDLKIIAQREKVVAIGEIGLDYHYDFSPRELQRKVFSEQLDLSVSLNLPAVIHMREATSDTLSILREHKGAFGVMHCYSGSAQTALRLIDMGFFISFTGAVTFKNAKKTAEAASVTPLNRLMGETDCPYLSPEPLRGRRNDPSNVRYVLQKLACIKGISFEEMCEINIKNAKGLFNIK
ncbi:MAG: TatD family hydrolase [Christensenellales bacterium]